MSRVVKRAAGIVGNRAESWGALAMRGAAAGSSRGAAAGSSRGAAAGSSRGAAAGSSRGAAVLLALALSSCTPRTEAAAPARTMQEATAEQALSAQAERLFRKAELLKARYRTIAVQIFVLNEAAEAGSEGDRGAARRAALEAESARLQAASAAAYAALVDAPALRAAKERPAALLALARALQDSGDPRGAEARLRQLVAEHPAASEAPEAYLALADLAFAAGRLDEAVSACDGVLRSGEAALRKRALYVKSWSLRGRGGAGDLGEAMEALREIVRIGPGSLDPRDAIIDESAERELVELYLEHGDIEEAAAFFASAGERAGPRLLGEVQARAGSEREERLLRPDTQAL